MSGILQTLIGGVLAIVGGLLAVWWQARHADDIARRIRQEERREQGLLTFRVELVAALKEVDEAFRSVEGRRELSSSAWTASYKALARLEQVWETDVTACVPDRVITEKFLEIRGLRHDLLPWAAPPPPRKDADQAKAADDFERGLGSLLAHLAWLKNEVDDRVKELLGK